MATHSTILALKIPWTEHPSGLVLMVKNPPPNAGDIRDSGWISGLGESPGGGHGNRLQYSCLENPVDRRTWWTMVCMITKRET